MWIWVSYAASYGITRVMEVKEKNNGKRISRPQSVMIPMSISCLIKCTFYLIPDTPFFDCLQRVREENSSVRLREGCLNALKDRTLIAEWRRKLSLERVLHSRWGTMILCAWNTFLLIPEGFSRGHAWDYMFSGEVSLVYPFLISLVYHVYQFSP